jgi:hypothetical protein
MSQSRILTQDHDESLGDIQQLLSEAYEGQTAEKVLKQTVSRNL